MARSDWSSVCDALREALPDAGVVLHLDDERDASNIGAVQSGFDLGSVPRYLARYARTNPWLAGTRAQPVGALFHADDLVPTDAFLKSRFWTEFLAPQGDFAGGSGAVLVREDGQQAMIGVNYSHRHLAPRRAVDELLHRVVPHLARGFGLWRETRVTDLRASGAESALSALSVPMLLIDGRRTIVFVNPGVEALLRRRDGLVSVGGTFRLLDREADAALEDGLARILGYPRGAVDPITVRKEPGEAEGPPGFYALTLVPLPDHEADLGFGGFGFRRGDLALVVVHDSAANGHLEPVGLRRTFGLTQTEAALAVALASGQTISDYARAHEVSRYTVRNQLGAVMRKTGTHRQIDLVALLTRMTAAL